MESLKKLAVLLSGLGIIVVVAWILFSATSKQPAMPDGARFEDNGREPQATYQRPTQPAPDNTFNSPDDPVNDGPDVRRPKDPITWKGAAPKRAASPPISGKMPMAGNPNPVFVNAAKRIVPAVVSIRSTRRVEGNGLDFLRRFPWSDEEENPEEEDGEEDIFQPGTGSGIIISTDGYIMTNNHVIEKAESITVLLSDNREFSAEQIGTDPTTDVAVLKISGENLPAAHMGNSDSVSIGEWVMAVGNPLNFTSTVTTGIVSALGRNINIIDRRYTYRIENFIQTDAVINPGNSGGALVNLNGEVIGMNTAIATRSGFYQGYGFAIPVNLVRKVVDDLTRFGRVRRAILGVLIEPVTDRTARALGMEKPLGALIQGVTDGSPAESVGLRQGDVIIAVDGNEIISVNDLQIKIASFHPDDKVTLTIWRDKKRWEIDVNLMEAPADNSAPRIRRQSSEPLKFENLGISVGEMSDEQRSLFGVSAGVLIEKIASGSPAEAANVLPRTVLLSIDDKPIGSVEVFNAVVAEAKSGDVLQLKLQISNDPDRSSRVVFVEVP